MTITKVVGLKMAEFRSIPADPDGYEGIGLLLTDQVGDFHAVFLWVPDSNHLLMGLAVFGIDYEIRDESLDMYVLGKKKPERLKQTREFLRPDTGGHQFWPVVKRVEFGKSKPDFHGYSIPARTGA